MATIAFSHVSKQFGNDTLAVDDLTLDVREGEFLILVGPSGCGKTTALRMVAGLEEISSGEIRIGDRVVNDLPPGRRDVAMVFQNYALYPHMSVHDNLAFPLRQQRVDKEQTRRRVTDVARLLGIDDLLKRKPAALSGGQRQRVAIGRALVREPQAFLMDEPLSNLDAKLRVQMRAELLSLHKRLGITTIYVTHDQTEAMTLGDRVVVLRAGVTQQIDAPELLYRQPANIFVAGFIGSPAMNFVEGRLARGVLELGAIRLELPEHLQHALTKTSGDVIVGVRPEDFFLGQDGAASVPAEVQLTEQLGPEIIVHLHANGPRVVHLDERSAGAEEERAGGLGDTLVARFDSYTEVRAGQHVRLAFNTERVQLFDRSTGESLLALRRAPQPEPKAPLTR